MAIGHNKPRIREFGNVKALKVGSGGFKPEIGGEMEPLMDVTTIDKEVKVILEMSGISEDKIKVNAYDNKVEVE